MNNKIVIKNREPQQITINGGGEVIGITTVLVNGIDVTEGSVAYVIVPTKTSELINDSGFITQETDPTIPYYIKQISQADINRWNNKQEQLVSGVNIKTINENSLLGSGNIDISTSYTAGYGININASNEISNTITSYNDLTDLPTIPTSTSELINDSDFVTSNELSDVAFSGSYADLSNIPEIPDSTSELINDSGFIDMDLLWNLFPKSTGSGASINLTDTVKNTPLYLTLGATELSQDGTPTPSSPQDIHTISGSNKVVVCGINIWDEEWELGKLEANIDLDTLEYCKIGTYEDKFIRNSGKQLFKPNFTTTTQSGITFTANDNYSVMVNGTASEVVGFTIALLGVEVGKTYTIGVNARTKAGVNLLCQKYKDGTYVDILKSFTNDETSYTFTVDSTFNQIRFRPTITSGTSVSNEVYYITLCKGTTALPYEPYGSNQWYIKKNIGKVVLDGSENWQSDSSVVSGTSRFYYDDNKYFNSGLTNDKPYALSPMFKGITWAGIYSTDTTTLNGIALYDSTNKWGRLVIRIENTYASDVATLKTWLGTNQPIVYYVLATPTYTQITGTLAEQLENIYNNLTSYSEQTNISQTNADLPFTITATTLKSLANI